jgi:hypothetical protein
MRSYLMPKQVLHIQKRFKEIYMPIYVLLLGHLTTLYKTLSTSIYEEMAVGGSSKDK